MLVLICQTDHEMIDNDKLVPVYVNLDKPSECAICTVHNIKCCNGFGLFSLIWLLFKCIWFHVMYRQTPIISCIKFENLNLSRIVWQLSLPNPLKPGVKSRMKMWVAQVDRWCSNYIWVIKILLSTKVRHILEVWQYTNVPILGQSPPCVCHPPQITTKHKPWV